MTEVLTFLIILKRVINTFNFFNHKLTHTLKCIEYKKNQYLYNTYIIMKKNTKIVLMVNRTLHKMQRMKRYTCIKICKVVNIGTKA